MRWSACVLVLVAAACSSARPMATSHHQQVVSASPLTAPSASSQPQLPAPAGFPPSSTLIYYHVQGDPDSVWREVDWTGSLAGSVSWSAGLPHTLTQSPDGSEFVVAPSTDTDMKMVVYRSDEQVVASIPADNLEQWDWADDSRHLCALRWRSDNRLAFDVEYVDPGGPERKVMSVAALGTEQLPQRPRVVACSSRSGLVALAYGDYYKDPQTMVSHMPTVRIEVYNLWSGRLIHWIAYPSNASDEVNVTFSADARMLAENRMGGATIRWSESGNPVSYLAGQGVYSFSWDDSQLVGAGARSEGPQVEKVSDGVRIWRAPPGVVFEGAMPRPGSQGFLVVGNAGQLGDLFVISGTAAREIAHEVYLEAWPAGIPEFS